MVDMLLLLSWARIDGTGWHMKITREMACQRFGYPDPLAIWAASVMAVAEGLAATALGDEQAARLHFADATAKAEFVRLVELLLPPDREKSHG